MKISVLVNKQTNSHNISETKFSNRILPTIHEFLETEFTKKEIDLLEQGPKFSPFNSYIQKNKEIVGVQAELIISNN